jgi:hypothetical protein
MYIESRKHFVQSIPVLIWLLACMIHADPVRAEKESEEYIASVREFLEERLYTRAEIDAWLEPKESAFSTYDPQVGYRNRNRVFKEGINGSYVTYRYEPSGARKIMMYAGRPSRINTYGSSFTDCEQVNDGETWQEKLAAHLGEPVRNFGVGGQTSYLSYVRMLREEQNTPADYIIMNITPPYERQMFNWQAIFYGKSAKHPCPPMPCVRVNSATGAYEEHPNPCPTPESLYKFMDLDYVYETLKDDFTLPIVVARNNITKGRAELSYGPIMRLAAEHGVEAVIDSPEKLREVADNLFIQESVYATMRTVGKIREYAEKHGKKVLYILTYASSEIKKRMDTGVRFDQMVLDFLVENDLPYVDLMDVMIRDFENYSISFDEYQKLHYIGHVSPMGNQFIAYQIKDKLVEIMNPKPLPYQ